MKVQEKLSAFSFKNAMMKSNTQRSPAKEALSRAMNNDIKHQVNNNLVQSNHPFKLEHMHSSSSADSGKEAEGLNSKLIEMLSKSKSLSTKNVCKPNESDNNQRPKFVVSDNAYELPKNAVVEAVNIQDCNLKFKSSYSFSKSESSAFNNNGALNCNLGEHKFAVLMYCIDYNEKSSPSFINDPANMCPKSPALLFKKHSGIDACDLSKYSEGISSNIANPRFFSSSPVSPRSLMVTSYIKNNLNTQTIDVGSFYSIFNSHKLSNVSNLSKVEQDVNYEFEKKDIDLSKLAMSYINSVCQQLSIIGLKNACLLRNFSKIVTDELNLPDNRPLLVQMMKDNISLTILLHFDKVGYVANFGNNNVILSYHGKQKAFDINRLNTESKKKISANVDQSKLTTKVNNYTSIQRNAEIASKSMSFYEIRSSNAINLSGILSSKLAQLINFSDLETYFWKFKSPTLKTVQKSIRPMLAKLHRLLDINHSIDQAGYVFGGFNDPNPNILVFEPSKFDFSTKREKLFFITQKVIDLKDILTKKKPSFVFGKGVPTSTSSTIKPNSILNSSLVGIICKYICSCLYKPKNSPLTIKSKSLT